MENPLASNVAQAAAGGIYPSFFVSVDKKIITVYEAH